MAVGGDEMSPGKEHVDWLGGVAVVVVLVVIGPAVIFFTGAVWSAMVGWFATDDAEDRYADSEYLRHRSW